MTSLRSPAMVLALALLAGPAAAQSTLQLRVTPERLRLASGERGAAVVTASTTDGSALPALALTWTTTDSAIVAVSADANRWDVGRLVAGQGGAAVIEVRSGAARAFLTVEVQAAPAPAPFPAPVAAAGPAPAAPSASAPTPVTRPPGSMNLAAIAAANGGAVALITMYGANEAFDGTGFVITPSGYLVTTRSVVSRQGIRPDSIVVRMADRRSRFRADVLTVSAEIGADLAILRVRDYSGPVIQRVDWAGTGARVGEAAGTIGFPGGAAGGLDRAGIPRAASAGGQFHQVAPDRILYESFSAGGSGGSPVFNADGVVVAVHRGRLSDGSAATAIPIRNAVAILPPGLRQELALP